MRAPVLVLVFALLAIVTLPALDRPGAIDVREARDGAVVEEMRARGEWLLPTLGGELTLTKPAAGYALEWLARRGLHGGVATSRAVRAATLALLLSVVCALARRAFGGEAAVFAGLAFTTALGVPLVARADGTAILASLFAWLGVLGLWPVAIEAQREPRRAPSLRVWLGWLAFGLGVACAGPLATLWPLVAFGVYLSLPRPAGRMRVLAPWLGLAIVTGSALPWYGTIASLRGPSALAGVLAYPYGDEARGPWYAGALVAATFAIVNLFPWMPMLVAALRDEAERLRDERVQREALRRGAAASPDPASADDARAHRAAGLLLLLLFAAPLPVAFWPTPPLTAAFAALPAAALLVGRYAQRAWRDPSGAGRGVANAARTTALLGTFAAVIVALFATRLPEAATALQRGGALLLVTSWAPMLADLVGRRRLALVLFAAPVALGTPWALTQALPAMEPWLNTHAVVEAMDAAAHAGEPLVLLEPAPPSLLLEAKRPLLVHATPWAGPQPANARTFVAFRPAREAEVARLAPSPPVIVRRTPTLVLARVEPATPALGPAPTTR